jgi:glutathione S-transferase
MKLYQVSFTPSSRKVRVFLREKGLDIPSEDVADGFQLAAWYKTLYPHALVPMLELDDGTQIGETMAICRYVETLHPMPSLMGESAKECALIEMWERRSELEGNAAVDNVFRNSHPLMMDRGLPGTAEPVPQIPALVERGMAQLRRFYEKLERQLGENHFVAGERFSIADISTLCSIDFGRWCQLDIPTHCKHVLRWYSEVSSRPSASA